MRLKRPDVNLTGRIKAFSMNQLEREASQLDTQLKNFDQRLIHDSTDFDFVANDADFDLGECAPILCEDDDEPDFSIMRKKEEKQAQKQPGIKKEQDIRKRFQIDKPAPNSA